MGKGPGIISGLSIPAAIIMIATDEIKMKNIQASTAKDPRQKLIEEVINNRFTGPEIYQIERESKCGLNMGFKNLVGHYCNEFNIPFNPLICIHSSKLHNMAHFIAPSDSPDKYAHVHDPKNIKAEMKEKIDTYNEAKKKAQEAYDALPWHQKVNWVAVIWIGIAAMGFLSLLFGK